MFEASTRPRLFALPPGTDFPALLVRGILRRFGTADPEALAGLTLYLNTRRMQRRVRDILTLEGARLLPRLRLVTDLGHDPVPGLALPVPPLRRRLELAQLVARLVEGRPEIAAGTAVFNLADSLAQLLAEMQGEGVALAALENPKLTDLSQDHARHWEESLRFIRIVARYLQAGAAPDPEARQRQVAEARAAAWAKDPPPGPVIVAGSTGSRGATALFMQAVARLPQGAVVLPGYDFEMPGDAWEALDAGPTPAEEHPQYRARRLMQALGLAPADILPWVDAPPPSPARNRLVSLALRPAPVTDQWMSEGPRLTGLGEACAEMALIEAPDPQTEALAIALALRAAAGAGQRAALVSADRLLTRRVAAELDRWGIVADDSAGQPLSQSPPGRFLRQVAALFGERLTVEALLALLKHPLCATGAGTRGDHLRHSRALELRLRRKGPAFPDRAFLTTWAAAGDEPDPDRADWADWLGAAIDGPPSATPAPLAQRSAAHLRLTETLAAGPRGSAEASALWREAAGAEARSLMAEIAREAAHGGTVSAREYGDLLAVLLAARSVRRAETADARIAIWGTLEARVQGADLVVLGGLNEGVWPPSLPPDPWLSRRMRQAAGLLLPERRIGLAAHDFQQAVAAPRVILSRAVRDAEAPTVSSRFLARLANLLGGLPDSGGRTALAEMTRRGQEWVSLAQRLRSPTAALAADPTLAPARRPAPCPPAAVRPRQYSVTEISTLIRDPYAVYARRILGLRPLPPLRPEPDARERGRALHRIVEGFVRDRPAAETPPEARARLMSLAEAVLADEIPWPSARRLWRARIDRIADSFVAAEACRANRGTPALLEDGGALALGASGFTLTARPDRIDLLADGSVHIYDYKSGKPPGETKVEASEKQLLLEARMAEAGAFKALGAREVAAATYIQLGGDGDETPVSLEDGIVTDTWARLAVLLEHYGRAEAPYPSRRSNGSDARPGDYDHLARYGEWAAPDPAKPEDVG